MDQGSAPRRAEEPPVQNGGVQAQPELLRGEHEHGRRPSDGAASRANGKSRLAHFVHGKNLRSFWRTERDPKEPGRFAKLAQLVRRGHGQKYNWADGRRMDESELLREVEKSSQLYADVASVAPIVSLLGSKIMSSAAGYNRVPVLLDQISVRVVPEQPDKLKHTVRIFVEYGSGLSKISWSVVRSYRDFFFLNSKIVKDPIWTSTARPPHLPGLKEFDSDKHSHGHHRFTMHHHHHNNEENTPHNNGSRQAAHSGSNVEARPGSPPPHPGARSTAPAPRNTSPGVQPTTSAQAVVCDVTSDNTSVNSSALSAAVYDDFRPQTAPTSLERALEWYLSELLKAYRFSGESNRIMQFLELSFTSVLLAPDSAYHGKEGAALVYSRASGAGWRVRHWHPKDLAALYRRHSPKWVLVCESFIILVENIGSTSVSEVFDVDASFAVLPSSRRATEEELRALIRHDIEKETKQQNAFEVIATHGTTVFSAMGALQEDLLPKVGSGRGFLLHLRNNGRELKLVVKSRHELRRWHTSLLQMSAATPWSMENRFQSFAPVRYNVFSQFFVDGRDYFWTLSEALENARDTIYILDWWLSPETYLRRPAESNQRWRLDRVLKRRAEAGVKIFIVVYRNVGATIPIDSLWTKHSMLDLHPNVHCLRSPNQVLQNSALFWAHHEKVCVIDHTIGFCGGIDLCFGRWDTPQHVLVDDAVDAFYKTNEEAKSSATPTQVWPGKDYSNPRVKDFFRLDQPYEEMYDRQVTPRMPWHDVHQMVIGQPARDLARHFTQRWNYVIRQKTPSRRTPLLIPPPDFTQEELERLGLTGTCEFQVLRSSGDWSLGLKKHEQSIQNAYIKLIDESKHFVYIENQFFISSTVVDDVKIENRIGDALVQRIIRAFEKGEKWRAIIVIPLMPGFEANVDTPEASSVRVICQCQFNTISRGPHSIFYRLEKAGIRPDQYISFFSLRKWGKIGPEKRLTTEQLYIHAKTMVVDDRVAIIGSANINERSQRGLRDSEIAVCVRDTEVINSTMAGKPFKAAKYAYNLRLRLMREHLGVDTDQLEMVEQLVDSLEDIVTDKSRGRIGSTRAEEDEFPSWKYPDSHSFNYFAGTKMNPGIRDYKKISTDPRIQGNEEHRRDVCGDGYDHMNERLKEFKNKTYGPSSYLLPSGVRAPLTAKEISTRDAAIDMMSKLLKESAITSVDAFKRKLYELLTGVDPDGHLPRLGDKPMPYVNDEDRTVHHNEPLPVDPWGFNDPISETFYEDLWFQIADRNTSIFRRVFRCQPDDEVETWNDYKKSMRFENRFHMKQAEEGGPETLESRGPELVDTHELAGELESDMLTVRLIKNATQTATDNIGNLYDLSQKMVVRKVAMDKAPDIAALQAETEPGRLHSSAAKLSKRIRERRSSKDTSKDGSIKNPSMDSFKEKSVADGSINSPSTIGRGESSFNVETGSKSATYEEYQIDDSNVSPKSKESHHVASSSAAGVPGLPTLSRLLSEPEGFDPKDSEFPDGKRHSQTKLAEGLSVDASGTHRADESDPHFAHTRSEYESRVANGTVQPYSGVDGAESVRPHRVFTSARRWTHFEQVLDAQVAEEVLAGVTGHLVVFPTEWLNRELDSGNWHFQMDRMAPLEIYD